MKICDALEQSMRNLVMTRRYESISVLGICESANASRSLFYRYFDNKDDLLDKIIEKDLVLPVVQLQKALSGKTVKSAPQLITEQIYLGVLEKKGFYTRVNAINNGSNLIRVITDKLTEINKIILETARISELEKDYYAYFAAASQAMLITKWISRGCNVESGQLAQFYRKWIMGYWGEIMPWNQSEYFANTNKEP